MKKLIIGVSGINPTDNPGAGIGVARSLKEDPGLKVKIVGLAYNAMDRGLFMDWIANKSFILPYPSDHPEHFINRLLYIKQSYGLDCVIPNLDMELPLYIKTARVLAAHGIRTFLPGLEQFQLLRKDRLLDIPARIGLALPRTKVVANLAGFREAIQEFGLPVMVKGGIDKAYFCSTAREAVSHYRDLAAAWGYPTIVQQAVDGDEMKVAGLGDGEGRALGLVAIKILSSTKLGHDWAAITVKNQKLLAVAKRLIREVKWRGPFELECVVKGDKVYLFELHPHFPAWTWFATGVGINLPARLVRRAFDLPVPAAADYEAGKLCVRYTCEMVTDLAMFQKIATQSEIP
jgi:carbamoyl-phosphate synthase large subunit